MMKLNSTLYNPPSRNLQHRTTQGYLPCSRRLAGYPFIDFWTTYIVTSNTGYSGQQQKIYILDLCHHPRLTI